jgi:hypothetical protein
MVGVRLPLCEGAVVTECFFLFCFVFERGERGERRERERGRGESQCVKKKRREREYLFTSRTK